MVLFVQTGYGFASKTLLVVNRHQFPAFLALILTHLTLNEKVQTVLFNEIQIVDHTHPVLIPVARIQTSELFARVTIAFMAKRNFAL